MSQKTNHKKIILIFLILCVLSIAFITNVESAPIRATAPNIGNVAVSDITDTSVKIMFTVDQTDADTTVHYGTSRTMREISDSINSGSTRTIKLSGLDKGTKYYFSVYANNGTRPTRSSHSGTDSFTTIGTLAPDDTVPTVGNVAVSDITNTSVEITFTVDQTDTDTIVHYGTMATITQRSNWNNNTILTRSITLSDLEEDTRYYLSIYAYNASDASKYSHSPTVNFRTNSSIPGSDSPILDNKTPEYGTGNRIWDGSKDMNTNYTWTPHSFAGFYYDIDNNLSSEELRINDIKRLIDVGDIVYTTSPQEVKFGYTNFGKYQVIGFMADKYFAGYKNSTIPGPTSSFDDISTLSQGQLHKVLIDDDSKRTISVGGTIALQDGYVLKATDIDLNARTMLLVLLKDGTEVDSSPLSKDETYVYKKRVGNVEDLPIIMVRFDNVFSGQELQTAFMKGLFQISDTPTSIQVGDSFGNMEVKTVSKDSLTMTNDASIGLSRGNTVNVMGNIKFKVADSGGLRFYPSVDVSPDMIGAQLNMDMPSNATGGDTINISITASEVPIEGVAITIEPESGLTSKNTDTNGTVNFTFPKRSKGIYRVTATKLGYESTNKTIDIRQYIEGVLSISIPEIIDQFDTVSIQTVSNSAIVSDAEIKYDNVTIGSTDKNGNLSYTFNDNGSHTITASKDNYVTVSRDIDVRAPYSEFRAKDINIAPNKTFSGEEIVIRSNITNVGTKGDTAYIDLIINGSIIDNRSISLAPKEMKEINFTHKVSLPQGNYTVEILDQEESIEVQKSSMNVFFIVALATMIGMVTVYMVTTKKGQEMANELIQKGNDVINGLKKK
jgi:S-layer protein (TIGR01567 family)